MTASHIAAALGRHTPKTGGGFMACCPAHDDKNPSLAIDQADDGSLLVKCFAGCDQNDVINALKSRGLWPDHTNTLPSSIKPVTRQIWRPVLPVPDDATPPDTTHYHHGEPSTVWRYLSSEGKLLQIICRFDTEEGKQVLPLTWCTDGKRQEWRWKGLPEPRPLYGLDLIGNAKHVVVVEGEKAADSARRLLGSLVVVTWPGGSNAVAKTDWTPLAGKNVAIWPDADEPGIKAAIAAAQELLKVGAESVKIVEPPEDAVSGWDLADADAEGWTGNRIREYLKAGLPLDEFVAKHGHLILEDKNDNGVSETKACLHVVRASELEIRPVNWLWQFWLALGKLAILAGPPGTGKTTIALHLSAVLTTAGTWPDGSQAKQGDVLIFSTEDDASDTLAPRLAAAGADLSRCHIISGIQTGEESRSFSSDTDIHALTNYLGQNPQIKMLIVDPVVTFVSGDSHKNTEVRRALQPLVDLAQKNEIAILGISHFSKGTAGQDPVDRVTGSVAFGAVARIVLAAAKLADDDQGRRLFARAKSNIGPDSGGFHYMLKETELVEVPGVIASKIEWCGQVEGSARELLAQAETHSDLEEKSSREEARDFLIETLRDGPVAASKINREAEQIGIARKTLKRAKQDAGVISQKSDFEGGWLWKLDTKGAKEFPRGPIPSVAPFDKSWPPSEDSPPVIEWE